ncbi:MAG: ribosomal protein S18-alanine N-acetyltransferase [Anaerolineales bacterium]|nr:ribosomal protein S18-alanine N-acetyltransferase [Anaerolineales bacterium]
MMNLDKQNSFGDLSGLFIRKMILVDLEQVVAIDQVSFSLPWPARSFQFELTDNPASRCWVVELDNKIIAMIVSWLILDELHVATIATHPDFRRQGIGKTLLTHALKSAREEGVTRSFLEVRESNQVAINMYKSFGFVEDGRRKEYYKDNHEDAILMTLNDLSHL